MFWEESVSEWHDPFVYDSDGCLKFVPLPPIAVQMEADLPEPRDDDATTASAYANMYIRCARDRRIADDWRLSASSFAALNAKWGPHDVDRFASDTNTLLPRFNSALECPGSEGQNAFSQDWSGTRSFCNPPYSELDRLAQFLEETGAAATVVAPSFATVGGVVIWTSDFPCLAALSTSSYVIPIANSFFRRDGLPTAHCDWHVRAFHIEGRR